MFWRFISDFFEQPKVIEENVLDNQVVLIEDAKLSDLDLIHSKASKVMKRVGEMLGIKTGKIEIEFYGADDRENLIELLRSLNK